MVEGRSLSRRFRLSRHGTSDSDEGHDFDCFQCVQVGRASGELKKHGSFKRREPALQRNAVGWRPGQPLVLEETVENQLE